MALIKQRRWKSVRTNSNTSHPTDKPTILLAALRVSDQIRHDHATLNTYSSSRIGICFDLIVTSHST
jgi:hypothetical protein